MILESFFLPESGLIRNDIDAITAVPPVLNVPAPENKFEMFDVLSEEEVSDIIIWALLILVDMAVETV